MPPHDSYRSPCRSAAKRFIQAALTLLPRPFACAPHRAMQDYSRASRRAPRGLLRSSSMSLVRADLTSHGWQIHFGSFYSASSYSAASTVEPRSHCPVEAGKTAAHLFCKPAALVACPCGPAHKIATSQLRRSARLARLNA